MAVGKTSERRIVAAERRAKAIEMRKAGATYEKIGQALGISAMAAHKAVTKALAEVKAKMAESVEEVRAIEVARLDSILLSLWKKRGEPRAADSMIRLMDRRSRLLGLDLNREAEEERARAAASKDYRLTVVMSAAPGGEAPQAEGAPEASPPLSPPSPIGFRPASQEPEAFPAPSRPPAEASLPDLGPAAPPDRGAPGAARDLRLLVP